MHPRPPRIGLTGSIGAGKSSVAALLAARGALVIDADALARQASEDPLVLAAIAEQLGAALLVAGRLDRAATAALVFTNPTARGVLEAIIHPWVRTAAATSETLALSTNPPPPLLVHDVPLLFETGRDAAMDATLVVDAPLETRVARLLASGRFDEATVRARDAQQLPAAEKRARATFVLDNSGDRLALTAALADLWPALLARPQRGP